MSVGLRLNNDSSLVILYQHSFSSILQKVWATRRIRKHPQRSSSLNINQLLAVSIFWFSL